MRRLDTQLLIMDWPDDPPTVLRDAVMLLRECQPCANGVGRSAGDSILVWRGYLTGGLLTLYERLVPLLDEYGLTGVFTTGGLQLCIAGRSEQAAALGVLRWPVRLDRGELDERVRSVASVEDLIEQLLHDSMAGAERWDDERRQEGVLLGCFADVVVVCAEHEGRRVEPDSQFSVRGEAAKAERSASTGMAASRALPAAAQPSERGRKAWPWRPEDPLWCRIRA